MVISFFGHAKCKITESEAGCVEQLILQLCEEDCTFYCGGYGDFDRAISELLDRMRNKGSKFHKVLVVPYCDEGYLSRRKNMLREYDEVVYPPLENVPRKYAIIRRNEWIVRHSDIVICYIRHDWGGATRAVEDAKRHGKIVYNIVDLAPD